MAVAAKQKPKPTRTRHKRQGTHQRRNNRFMKTYWPYLPIVTIIGIGLLVNSLLTMRPAILGYATTTTAEGLLTSTNQEREKQHISDLTLSHTLSQAAQAKANDMVARNYWSHKTPDGQEPWTFIDSTGYTYQKAGENLAYGFSSSDATVSGWMNSLEHRQNMLDGTYSEVGFGIANSENYQQDGKQTVVVAMYAKPSNAAALAATPQDQTATSHATNVRGMATVPQEVSRIQIATTGAAPWSLFAVSAGITVLLILLVTRHGLAWRRVFVRGEAFILKHRMLDVIFVSLIMTGYVLSRTVGIIQ